MFQGVIWIQRWFCASTLLLLVAFGLVSAAPRWTTVKPLGKSHVYAVGLGESRASLVDARKAAITSAIGAFNTTQGVTLTNRIQLTKIEDSTSYREAVVDELEVKGISSTLTGVQIVETYIDCNSSPFRVWALISMPGQNQISHLAPVWRSAIVPGWGQYYQGYKMRGVGLLLAETASIGGAFFSSNEYSSRKSKANKSVVKSTRDEYNKQADMYYQMNVVCVCVAVASYALNMADVLLQSPNRSDLYYAVTATPGSRDVSPKVAISLSIPFQLNN